MKEMFNFKDIGQLTLDKVFFASYYPILFTCNNKNEDLYLCVCCQAEPNLKKWLISRTQPQYIIKLLKNEITIRDAFLLPKSSNEKYTIIHKDNKSSIELNNKDDWNSKESIFLPTEGEYIDADPDEFIEEIEYYNELYVNKLCVSEINENLVNIKLDIASQIVSLKSSSSLFNTYYKKILEMSYDNLISEQQNIIENFIKTSIGTYKQNNIKILYNPMEKNSYLKKNNLRPSDMIYQFNVNLIAWKQYLWGILWMK